MSRPKSGSLATAPLSVVTAGLLVVIGAAVKPPPEVVVVVVPGMVVVLPGVTVEPPVLEPPVVLGAGDGVAGAGAPPVLEPESLPEPLGAGLLLVGAGLLLGVSLPPPGVGLLAGAGLVDTAGLGEGEGVAGWGDGDGTGSGMVTTGLAYSTVGTGVEVSV